MGHYTEIEAVFRVIVKKKKVRETLLYRVVPPVNEEFVTLSLLLAFGIF